MATTHTVVYIEVLRPGRGRRSTWSIVYPFDTATSRMFAEHWIQRLHALTSKEAQILITENLDALPGKYAHQPDRELHKAVCMFGTTPQGQ